MKLLKQRKKVKVNKSLKINNLNPSIDSQDALRVGGGLTQAALHPFVKHPAEGWLGHHMFNLLIRHFHEKVKHQGHKITTN